MKRYLILLSFFAPFVLLASKNLAFKTLEGYAISDRSGLFYNYAFDFGYASINTGITTYGLSRYSKHQDEINVIYGLNLVANILLLSRYSIIVSDNGLFNKPYKSLLNEKNLKLRERIAEYRLMEIQNSVRQLRKISSFFTLISSIFVAAFSEGKKYEILSSLVMAGNSIFYMWFYESYGEDCYDKYFFFKKAHPEIFISKNSLRVGFNIPF